MSLGVVVGHAAGDGEVVAELEAADQGAHRGHAAIRILRLGAASVAGEIQSHILRERGARLDIDDAAQAAFAILRRGILDDVDAADFLARDAFQRGVLQAGIAAAAGGFACDVDFPAP